MGAKESAGRPGIVDQGQPDRALGEKSVKLGERVGHDGFLAVLVVAHAPRPLIARPQPLGRRGKADVRD